MLKNPLYISGIIPKETAEILLPPPSEVLPGRKRPLRIKSSARVMTSFEVVEDLQSQKAAILEKSKPKAKKQPTKVW